MADNTVDKEALKAAKEAEKAAKKAKQERVKQSKPKKEGNVFSRAGRTIKKFWKDFIGTVKKIVWPGPKQVVKSSLIVLATIIVVGLLIYGIDQGLTSLFNAGTKLAESAGQQLSASDTVTEEETDAAGADEEAEAEEETDAGEEAAEATEAGEETAEEAEAETEAAAD